MEFLYFQYDKGQMRKISRRRGRGVHEMEFDVEW